jgi:hypothetical protein
MIKTMKAEMSRRTKVKRLIRSVPIFVADRNWKMGKMASEGGSSSDKFSPFAQFSTK